MCFVFKCPFYFSSFHIEGAGWNINSLVTLRGNDKHLHKNIKLINLLFTIFPIKGYTGSEAHGCRIIFK